MAIYNDRVCRNCGITFLGGPRAWYCPNCRKERQRQAEREAKARARAGKTRKIGSRAICENCGEYYTVNGSKQKYCDNCRDIMYKFIDNEQGTAYYRNRVDKAERSRKRRAYYAQNKDMLNAKRRQFYAQNKDKIQLQSKKWRLVNRYKISEYNKQYRQKNKEHRKQQEAIWRDQNREERNRKQNNRYWASKFGERIYAFVFVGDSIDLVYGNPMSKHKTGKFRAVDGAVYDKFKKLSELTDDEQTLFTNQYNLKNSTSFNFDQIVRMIKNVNKYCSGCGKLLPSNDQKSLCSGCAANARQRAYYIKPFDIKL